MAPKDVTAGSVGSARRTHGVPQGDVVAATHSYETWLGRHTPIVRADLREKHRLIAESPFVFLRGTFYRWAQRWPEVCAPLCDAPRVLAVGDLHVENFGTWRDVEGRLVWGVNDLDEAALLPYTSDLVRLVVSAALAAADHKLDAPLGRTCRAVLDGYTSSLSRGGRPIVLAERHGWLRQIALHELKDPDRFWEKLGANPRAAALPPSLTRLMALPAGADEVRLMRRRAGVGSLGRPRFVAQALYDGGLIAREAKAVVPSAVTWATGGNGRSQAVELGERAIRAADPFYAANPGWSVRRLSPDCLKIDLADLPRRRDDARLLRAMGWETANMHLGSGAAPIGKDLARRGSRWLERASADMIDTVTSDYRAWKKHQRR